MAKQRPLSERLSKLPPGRHLIPSDYVAQNQRERILLATAELVAERGYQKTTIELIAKTSKVALVTFYEHFPSKEECFLAAFDVVVAHIGDLVAEAVESAPDWPHQAVAAAREVLAFLASEPDLARLCLVEAQSAGPVIARRFHEAVRALAPPLERGRAERSGDRDLPPNTEEQTVGALVSLASRKVAAGEATALEDLLPDFTQFILSPFLGPDEAERLAAASA